MTLVGWMQKEEDMWKRRQPTRRESGLIKRILQLEADGGYHTGAEIDRLLAVAAADLGYSDEDLAGSNPTNGRSAFGNECDWAMAMMIQDRLHEVVGTTADWQRGTRHECHVYRITPRGLDELRKHG